MYNYFQTIKKPLVLLASFMSSSLAYGAPPGDIPFGVYDPEGAFSEDKDVSIEHLFMPWEDVYLPSLAEADQYATERGRSVLVTVEPWTWTVGERRSRANLQAGIENGNYDQNMRSICSALDDFKAPVTLRWGHEMEDHSGQFIWAGWTPEVYVAAYKRMVNVCKAEAPDVEYLWSPMGVEDMEKYYPGDDYVDAIGLSVFGYQQWEKEILGKERSFREILEPRYERALAFNKPIVVAELGFYGDKAYFDKWTSSVRTDLAGFDKLEAVLYFNYPEVYPWPNDYGYPDWRFDHNVTSTNVASAKREIGQ